MPFSDYSDSETTIQTRRWNRRSGFPNYGLPQKYRLLRRFFFVARIAVRSLVGVDRSLFSSPFLLWVSFVRPTERCSSSVKEIEFETESRTFDKSIAQIRGGKSNWIKHACNTRWIISNRQLVGKRARVFACFPAFGTKKHRYSFARYNIGCCRSTL